MSRSPAYEEQTDYRVCKDDGRQADAQDEEDVEGRRQVCRICGD